MVILALALAEGSAKNWLPLIMVDGHGPDPTARVSLVASIGYVALLAVPPALGFLGNHYDLRGAMVVVLAFLAVAAAITPALRVGVSPKAPAAQD